MSSKTLDTYYVEIINSMMGKIKLSIYIYISIINNMREEMNIRKFIY